MSISSNFPAFKPSLLLDFANVKALDPRITFTRTTTATYYDGKTTAKAEENLLLQSQDFTTTWLNNATTDTANTEVAPDGTTTAETLTTTAATNEFKIFQSYTSSAQLTFSVFAKKGTHDYIQLRTTSASSGFVNFDLNAGTASATTATGSIISVGNGWYRCVATFVAASITNVQIQMVTSLAAIRGESWTAAGTETVYLWGAQLEQRSAVSAYTPTTTQAITNYTPVLQTAASGVARFDHNPTTGESLGLLVEEQRTNLVTYSEDFSDSDWSKVRTSITANTIVAPDGTLTGGRLSEDTSTDSHSVFQNIASVATGTVYTFSVYAKRAGRDLQLLFGGNDVTGNPHANFDLTNGTVSFTNGTITATITAVGNGWYRCTAAVTSAVTTSFGVVIGLTDSTTAARSVSYTGDGYSGIYIWGAQLEAASFSTSYIPTTSASVTRNADVATMTGTNFSSWYRADEGMLYLQAIGSMPSTLSGNRAFVALSDGTYSNVIQIVKGSGAAEFRNEIYSGGGAAQAAIVLGGYVINQQAKVALGYKVNDVNAALNGTLGTTDTSATIPTTVNKLELRDPTGASGGQPTGWIQRIAFYPSRLSDAQLQALTT